MSLIFYYAPMSTASTTTFVLTELDIPCEWKKIDFAKKETRTPEFLKINPNGHVPTIVHHGHVVFESAAITIYLGETFGVEKKLWPHGAGRGDAMKWVVWCNVSLGEAVYRWARNTQWAPEDQRNAKAAETALADIESHLSIFDRELAGKPFLAGEYTLADAHCHSFIDWLRHMKIDMAGLEHLDAWSKRVSARPAHAKALAREQA